MFSRLLTANICSELLKSVNKMIMRTGTKALDNDPHRAWWKEASVYQIYPSSFKDSNGDGLGDIPGIIEKLDYMKGLGVDVVWLSPVYKSPQVDMGYDISDYYDIDARYGTVKDIETLINGLHCRGMKLVMDLVVNHTSDQHGWFLESKASKNSPKRDWYIWRPAKYDTEGARRPPNNWRSIFGGSAWRWDERTQEYYLHLFCPEQPDLNWENPTVRTAVYDAMSFWLNKGVDGFRMDVINLISKVPSLPDAPVTLPGEPWQPGTQYYANGPRMHEFLHEMRKEVLDKYDAMTVGEMPWIKTPEEVLKAIGRGREELDMVFQFDIVDMDLGASGKFTKHDWDLKELKGIVNTWQTFMQERGGWNALFLENHDQPRSISRFVTDKPELRGYAAKMLATFYALQRGTLYLYQGQELGMSNLPKDWGITEYKDVETLNHWNQVLEERGGNKGNMDDVMEMIQFRARDNSRTPIQWDDSANAGFTTGDPWMRVNDDYKSCNAAQQISDKNSVYNYWRSLLELRKGYEKLFIYGHFKMLTLDNQMVFAYQRTFGGSRAVIVSNFSVEATPWSTEDEGLDLKTAERIMGNYNDSQINDGILLLRPLECAVFIF